MGLIQNKVTVSQPNSHVVVKNAGGLRGLTGETGPQGPQGVPGEAATVTAGTTTTLPAGSDATVQNVGSTSAAIFNFGIPKGDKGDTGESGAAATISVGSTSTLPAGSSATVTNSGTSSAAVFDFGIPKGDKGDTGATGADGYSPSATVTKTGDTATITITDKDGTTTASISDGTTPTVNDGTLTIQKNGTTVQTFSADQASNVTANITVPTQFSELSGTVSSSQIADEAITTGSVTGTGTNITLAGTMDGGAIESVEMNGDTEQTTYSGKNLYEGSPSFDSYNSISAWEDGGTYNGMPVVKRAAAWTGVYRLINIEAGVTYTFSAWVKSDEARPVAIYAIGSGATATITPNNKNITTTTSWERVSFTFTCSTSGTIALRFENTSASTTNYTYISGYQLEKNSSATSFEPYVGGTASPNPDYPQEVQTVTGEQSIEIRGGKNLFNKATVTSGYLVERDTGKLSAIASYSASDYIPVVAGQTYTFTPSKFNRWYTAIYNSNKTYIGYPTNSDTFTIPANGAYIRATVYTDQLDSAQFELGSSATTYEPYKGVTKTVNLGKNLCNPADVTDIFLYTLADKAAYLSGNTSVVIPVEQNTKYTVSTTETQSRYRVAVCDSIPVQGGGDVTCYSGTNIDNTSNNVTISTGTHKYLIVNATDFAKIQIEKSSTATTYAPYFTPIELCKIGDYQDYIYKSGEDWYIKKTILGLDMSSIASWEGGNKNFYSLTFDTNYGVIRNQPQISNIFTYSATSWAGEGKFGIATNTGALWLTISDSTVTSSNLSTWLGNKNGVIYAVLATPTDTKITDATLISELDSLLSATTYSDNTYITVSGDLASPLEVVAEADSKLAPDSVYGAAIKDGAVSTDKIEDGAVTPDKISTSAYQSGETAVGTWIDGKTIYRQVLTGTVQITANTVATVTTTIAAKSIVSTSGWYQSWKQNDTTSNKVAFGHIMGDKVYSYALIRSGNYIELGFISSVNVTSQYEVVVEYTKKD